MKHNKNLVRFRELNPEEFAKEFGYTNYCYQKECFNELKKEYLIQSKKYKKINKTHIASSLEQLAITLHLVNKTMEKICNIYKNYMKNPLNN